MEFPEEVITKNKKGQREVRSLLSRGRFVLYDYRDVESFKVMENGKRKMFLKDDDGNTQAFFIIPLKDEGRYLMIADDDKGDKKVWNSKKKKAESLF